MQKSETLQTRLILWLAVATGSVVVVFLGVLIFRHSGEASPTLEQAEEPGSPKTSRTETPPELAEGVVDGNEDEEVLPPLEAAGAGQMQKCRDTNSGMHGQLRFRHPSRSLSGEI